MGDGRPRIGANLRRRLRREPPPLVPPTEETPASESQITVSAGASEQAAADDAELDALRGELLRELGRMAERSEPDEK